MKNFHTSVQSVLFVVIIAAFSFAADAAAQTVTVNNVEDLYTAVNDAANAGATVVLAPGVYMLSVNDPNGVARPNKGRIELQENMSLTGLFGDRSAVTVDASGLPPASFKEPGVVTTAPIRIGRGSNSVEWITIIGQSTATASIETDLIGMDPAQVRVAYVTAHGSARGVDVRNTGAAMSGRVISAEIVESEFFDGLEGIRFVDVTGANNASITGRMSGNYLHDNENGCLIENNRASFSTIYVRSTGDLSTGNVTGCVIGAGLAAAPGSSANNNTTTFEAQGSSFINNTAPYTLDRGGIVAFAAETPNNPNGGSNNTLTIRLWGCNLYGNQNSDFEAYGARAVGVPEGSVGTNNKTTIELHGVSKFVDIIGADSVPFDATGTNTVTVIR